MKVILSIIAGISIYLAGLMTWPFLIAKDKDREIEQIAAQSSLYHLDRVRARVHLKIEEGSNQDINYYFIESCKQVKALQDEVNSLGEPVSVLTDHINYSKDVVSRFKETAKLIGTNKCF